MTPHGAKFKKLCRLDFTIKRCAVLGPSLGKNGLIDPNGNLLEKFISVIICTNGASSSCKISKNSLEHRPDWEKVSAGVEYCKPFYLSSFRLAVKFILKKKKFYVCITKIVLGKACNCMLLI